MYKTLNLLYKGAKSKKGGIFFSKKSFSLLRREATKFSSFVSKTGRTFAFGGDRKFEKISDRSPSSSSRQGKFNIRTTMMSEPLFNLLNFVGENGSNMNDADFLDTIQLVSMKIENDSNRRLNFMNIEKNPGYVFLKQHIQMNFDRIMGDNIGMQLLLALYANLNLRARANMIFTNENGRRVIEENLANITNNHSRMTTNGVLSVLSYVCMFRNVPGMYDIVSGRKEEIPTLGFRSLQRILKRAANERVGEQLRETYSRMLVPEFLNLTASETMINKCRAFNIVAHLESLNPFAGQHRAKMGQLLKEIRSQAENHDQQSILVMIEAMTFYDDATRTETLKEFYEIVTMTIKHLAENVKLEFVLRFISYATELKADFALNADYAKIILDYVCAQINVQAQDETRRLPSYLQFMPIFSFMRKAKYNDKETVEKLVQFVEPMLFRLPIDVDIRNFRFVVKSAMGEEFYKQLENKVVNDMEADFSNKVEVNLNQLLSQIGKLTKFRNEHAEKMINDLIQKFSEKIKAQTFTNNIMFIINKYVNEVQDLLNTREKVMMTDILVDNLQEIDLSRNVTNNAMLLFSLFSKTENETTKAKLEAQIAKLIAEPKFRDGIVPQFLKIAKEGQNMSSYMIFKFTGLIREFAKDPEYVSRITKFFDKLVLTVFHLAYNIDRDSKYNLEAVSSLLSLFDNLYRESGFPPLTIHRTRVPTIIKTLEKAKLYSSSFNRSLGTYLENSRQDERENLSNDMIIMMDKVLRSDLPSEDLDRIISKVIPNAERAQSYLNNANNTTAKISIIKFYFNLAKKRTDLFHDEYLVSLKNYLIEDVMKGDQEPLAKLNALLALTGLKPSLMNFRGDNKEFSNLMKSVMEPINFKRLSRAIDTLPNNPNSFFIRRIVTDFAQIYENTENIDRQLFLRCLDKITTFKWTNPSFFNKVISDYENLFDSMTGNDQAQVVEYLARVEFNKEDVILAAVKNINTRQLNEYTRVTLFDSLVKLGFTNQEWKQTILEKLIQEIELTTLLRLSLKEKMSFIISLWKLGDWPSNNKDLTLNLISSIKKKPRFESFRAEWVGYIRQHPLFSSFEPEIREFIETLFNQRVQYESRQRFNKYLTEYLVSMGHSDLKFMPEDKLCEIYLPQSNMGIVILTRNRISLAANEINPSTNFCIQTLKNSGVTPIVVDEQNFTGLMRKDSDHEQFVEYLTSLNIPNLKPVDKMDFSAVNEMRNFRERSQAPVEEKDEEEQH